MIDVLFEQQIVQNPGLGAEALWYAVNTAYQEKNKTEGFPLLLAFIVLPLVFHRRSATALASKTKPGALYKAIASDREITLGFQERMQALSDRTLQSLSIAFSTDLLLLDPAEEPQLIPGIKTPPVVHATKEVKTLLSAAKRVGQAISEIPMAQIATHLNIRF
ncbi:hypothetical protein EST62_11465 [Chlorobaculum sp. 24CR]|uniref:three component ABC system middle component n=1 Tax=Chlorobaculum sp. 24CR TaxID=2508878 RepID=UPI00100BE0A9|nr:three component ABC system middle component [Chlorobaculum sp. 24CR]RXK82171.1 hypothetical protein EST62_11465 [Chlorobaculum sp. 24CR]